MMALAILLLSCVQAEEPDLEVRVVLLDAAPDPLPRTGATAWLEIEDPAGFRRSLPMTLAVPRGFERLDAVAPEQVRPVEGTPWRAGLRALPLPSPTADPIAARAEPAPGPYHRVRLRSADLGPGCAVSVRFEFADGAAWARGFTLRPEHADPEPAR